MTNNKEECCENCYFIAVPHSAIPHCPNCVFPPNYNCDCSCHVQEEWENKIIPEYSSIAVLDEYAVDGYYIEPAVLFITNLLRTEREKATTEAAQHYALGREHGRDFAYIEVRKIVGDIEKKI